MEVVRTRAHGKINLGLDVLRKREDGYHEVRTIMQRVGLYDGIEIQCLGNLGAMRHIGIETNLKYLPANENNLAYRAAELLMDEFGITESIHIKIRKMIPVAAGMGGGSADAAAVLKGINRMFDLHLTEAELMERSIKLGADVPYCVMGGTALAEGIGEILTPIPPMPECIIVLAKPSISVSTRIVYGNLNVDEIKNHPDIDGMIDSIYRNDLRGMAGRLGNVLEEVTVAEYPVIGEIKQIMLNMGALNAVMSGSGPTVFGVFDDVYIAKNAYMALKSNRECRQVYITDGGNGDERY
ncbi:MAG: 4-(cytidine 5'-diphospho)-2-C-methyl-D-erythritol kinase [Lachnospiraceae bacterium]